MTDQPVSPSTQVWRDKWQLEMDRIAKLRELGVTYGHPAMRAYDQAVYNPALAALMERCEAIGHRPRDEWHDNGFGWFWRYCNQCGARVDLERRY